jgi:hypothetical protein
LKWLPTLKRLLLLEPWLLLCGHQHASYILGDFEVKVLREYKKTAMQTEQQDCLRNYHNAKEVSKVLRKAV